MNLSAINDQVFHQIKRKSIYQTHRQFHPVRKDIPSPGEPGMEKMFGISGTCAGCGLIIPPNEFVAKAPTNLDNNNKNPFPATHHLFHLKCFTCTKCGSVLKSGDR
uniref:LIM zinc-binding domain-containing protein n=1 Tax=Megaselia scalaris TaxID=36166 RepID=T1GMZ7_MEGSC